MMTLNNGCCNVIDLPVVTTASAPQGPNGQEVVKNNEVLDKKRGLKVLFFF